MKSWRDEHGTLSFNLLQGVGSAQAIVLYAFDLLMLRGKDVRGWPLEDRGEGLREVIPTLSDTIRYSGARGFRAGKGGSLNRHKERQFEGPYWESTILNKRREPDADPVVAPRSFLSELDPRIRAGYRRPLGSGPSETRTPAERLAMKVSWVYRRKLPFRVRLGTVPRFSEKGLEDYIRKRLGT